MRLVRLVLLLAVVCSVVLASSSVEARKLGRVTKHAPEVVDQFNAFVLKHKRSYLNDEAELAYRLEVFAQNLKEIEDSNARNAFYSEVNEFADETWEEFSVRLSEPQADCSATLSERHEPMLRHHHPESQDWREKGVVSPVKNQGHCGSCWSFSTTGALEAAYALEFGSILSLSEQQLVDCAQAFDNHGCSGGLPSHAFEYIRYNGGLDLEAAYPYEGRNGTECHYKPDAAAVFVKDVVNITEGDEKMLQHAVGNIKPVSIAFEVVSDFRFYKNGTYTSNECRRSATTVNHAVLAVGYHKDHYWIIKNSWGAQWGMDGYFRMGPIGRNMCGIATCSSFPILEDPHAPKNDGGAAVVVSTSFTDASSSGVQTS
ncbi:papain cysteine protease [Chloropicon primus]|nr:papain cysteine protease [Chloropicon primus]